jgi:hypothetical protein
MNKGLIFKLSLFGLIMAFGTVFFIPSKIEPLCWLVIFIICAYLIAKNCKKMYFLHGFLTSLVNCVWVTGVHILLFNTYLAHHPDEASMMSKMPIHDHPRLLMLITGPIIGIVSGLILGFFSFIAGKFLKKSNL